MKAETSRRRDPEIAVVAWLASCVSIVAFLFYLRHGDILLYGDAVAHINIARRVFDSRTPGLLQLGTVWLPLPHLLMIPFLLSDRLWQSGVGGSIPSLVAYVFGVVGIFRLVRGALSPAAARAAVVSPRDEAPDVTPHGPAWLAAAIFAVNPNLIYLQMTAMTESLYLAFFVWAVVYFGEFARATNGENDASKIAAGAASGEREKLGSLTKCGLCVMAACLTRYDGWFLAGTMAAWAMVIGARRWKDLALRRSVRNFILLTVAAPVFWLAYNGIIYGDPLEFENGPYSAKAIEKKTAAKGEPTHPGAGSLGVSALYFLKSAELNMAEGKWWQWLWVVLAAAGSLAVLLSRRGGELLLLWVPLPFYALSISHGAVPIFLPMWWPFSYYNVRYGLQLLPAFAGFAAATVAVSLQFLRRGDSKAAGRVRVAIGLAAIALAVASYANVWQAQPASYREAAINMRSKRTLEQTLARWLRAMPADSTLLMYLGDHVGALQEAGIPLRRAINEGNHRTWKRPVDPEGLWERALAAPSEYADYVVAFDGDPVATAVTGRGLKELVEISTTGQPRAVVYAGRAR